MPASLGYSPELLLEQLKRAGNSPVSLGVNVSNARWGQPEADPALAAMTPEDRAALDRYATFANMAQGNPAMDAVNYLGGMGAMGLTEGVKLIPGAQDVLTALQSKFLGTAAEPFGGKDTSKPNLANLVASHYGFMEGRKRARGSK